MVAKRGIMRMTQLCRDSARVLTACGIAILFLIRIRSQLIHPAPFAEEGGVFLASWLNGSFSLLNGSYINLFSAMGLRILYSFGFAVGPLLACLLACGVTLGICLYWLRPQWDALLPWPQRAAIIAWLLLFSVYSEGLGILLYSFWWLGLLSFFLFYEVIFFDSRGARALRALVILIATLSGPLAIQFAAAFVVVLVLDRDWTRLFRFMRSPTFVSLGIGTLFQAFFVLKGEPGEVGIPYLLRNFFALPQACLFQISSRIVAPLFVSDTWIRNAMNASKVLATLPCFLTAALIFFLWRNPRSRFWILSALLILLSTYVGRPDTFRGFKGQPWNVPMEALRYSVIPAFLIVVGALRAWGSTQNLALRALQLYIVFFSLSNFPRIEKFVDISWPLSAQKIEDFRRGVTTEIQVPIQPEGRWLLRASKAP